VWGREAPPHTIWVLVCSDIGDYSYINPIKAFESVVTLSKALMHTHIFKIEVRRLATYLYFDNG
jgi:hypothetical protein